jgi:hypothetical protein
MNAGKITVRSGGRTLGTIEKISDTTWQIQVRRTCGIASSLAEGIKLLRTLSSMLDKRCNAA